jgi:hypothetical protein
VLGVLLEVAVGRLAAVPITLLTVILLIMLHDNCNLFAHNRATLQNHFIAVI